MQIDRDREVHELTSAFRARLAAASLSGERLVEQFRHDAAKALIRAGITLIPSENLQDHQIVVSRGVYNAAKKEFDLI